MPSTYETSPIPLIVSLIVAVVILYVGWKIYAKAGKPGWAVIVPIYNVIVLLQIVNRPIWWFILYLIPVVNVVVAVVVALDLAKSFGKGTGFAVGLFLLPVIFAPILAFDDSKYAPIPRV